MWFIRGVIILIGVLVFLLVGTQNAGESVDFTLVTKKFENLNLNLLLLTVFAAGMVLSFLIAAVNEIQLRAQLSSGRRNIDKLKKEIAALRSLPLEENAGPSSVPPVGEVD